MKCRFLAGMLAAALLLPTLPVHAEGALSGTCHGLEWKLTDHVLTISGTGVICCNPSTFTDDDAAEYPEWRNYAEDIYEIVIVEGVTGVQDQALAGYPHLQKLTLPSTFRSLAPYALSNDSKLIEIVGLENVTDYQFGCLTGTAYTAEHPYIVTDGKLYYAECTGQTALIVPDGVTEIMPFAFGNLTGEAFLPKNGEAVPVTVTLPDTVEVIHDSAFAFCAGITEIRLPEGLREIGAHAFFDCAHLGSLTLGEQVETVGEQAFFNCRSLECLTVMNPDTVLKADAYGRCYDWKAALESRRGTELTDSNYEKLLHRIEQYPFCMDEEMAYFAVHFWDTHPYSTVKFQNGYEAFLEKRGRIAGWRESTAQQFAADKSLRFELLDAQPGDVDLDGVIDIVDVIALNKHLLGVAELRARSRTAADFNADRTVNSDDSSAILHYILGIQAV